MGTVGKAPAPGAAEGPARPDRWWTVALAGVTVGTAIVSAVLIAMIGGARHTGTYADPLGTAVWFAMMLTASAIGVLVPRRQPGNRIAILFAAGGAAGGLSAALDAWSALGLDVDPGSVPGATVARLLSTAALYVCWGIIAILVPLRFPTGELLSRRWRIVSWGGVAAAVACSLQIFHPGAFQEKDVFVTLPGVTNPIGIPGFAPIAELSFAIGIYLIFAATFAAIVSLVVRYRRGDALERRQLKWVTSAVVAVTVVNLAVANANNAFEGPVMDALFFLSAFTPLLILVSMGLAILRERLFDIDVVISKAATYFAMAAFITAVYVATVTAVARVFGTDRDAGSGASIIATAVVAVAFHPVRERLQRVANRIVFGQRTTPYETITGFAHRLASGISATDVLPEMAKAAARGIGADRARVRLLAGGANEVATWPDGAPTDDAAYDLVLPVIHGGEVVGDLAAGKPASDPVRDADERVLRDLASQAGPALANLELTAELRRRLEELQASRQRLVKAQDEERRRMERDLHDGAQQLLIAMGIKLNLVTSVLDDDPADAVELLGEVRQDARDALESLRDLARGIFPPTLAEKGVPSALAAHITKMQIPATVDAGNLGDERFAPEAEAAVYFCIREAMQNASKHAPGKPIVVTFERDDDHLRFEVVDQGPGFDPETVMRGSGLQNMVDRVEALGGRLRFDVAAGGGTAVCGEVPSSALVPA